MARIRTIKPSFWEDEKIARLPRACRLFYIGMWNQADDMGVIRGNPALLKSAIFPYDEDLRVSEVQKWIDALVNARMLIPITYKSESYYIIRTFRSHQKFDARYPNFIIPEEISSKEIDNYEHPTGTQRVHTEYPPREREGEMDREYNTPYSPPSGEVYDDLGNHFYDNYPKIHQEEKEKSSAKKEKEPNYSFEDFWELYDKKVGKKDSLIKKWLKLSDTERELAMSYIPQYKQCQPDKKYRKNPETFLNQKAWNDELIFDYGNRKLPPSDQVGFSKPTGNSSGNDAANKRAELDNLENLAEAVLRGTSPSDG